MLSCKELSLKASDYLEGDLPLYTRIGIRLHLAFCQHCRRHLHQLRLVAGALTLSGKRNDAGRGEADRIVQLLRRSHGSVPPVTDRAAPEVEIYTTAWCPYCRRAKRLLDRKGVRYREIAIDGDPLKRQEMIARADGRSTVPQIFINGRAIGGSDDLHALEASGRLAGLLGEA